MMFSGKMSWKNDENLELSEFFECMLCRVFVES